MSEPVPRTGDWRLVAPWWRWQAQGGDPRSTHPAFQKYDSSSFVTDFMANPQRCLKIDDTDDRVQKLVSKPAAIFGGRLRALSDSVLEPTTTLKLFLPNHKRFYLVVCELHCERAGFPNADRTEACQAGFVVRRRRFDVGSGTLGEARTLITRVERAVASLEELNASIAADTAIADDDLEVYAHASAAVATAPAVTQTGLDARIFVDPLTILGEPYARAQAELTAARGDLLLWARASGATGILEGWVVGPDKVGRWQQVKERPGKLVESTYPLHGLVPPAAVVPYLGASKATWFGVVPTSSSDHDKHGVPRFDDTSLYEIRCFVRRHKVGCPRNPVGQDCHGELTWSAPTERYQLASHFDLTGTANHATTIQLPDIPKLKAQAASLPIGKGASVKMVTPAGSSMRGPLGAGIGGSASPGSTKLGGAQICSMSIPLITIVAQFALNIFLPIIVALFQLYALLRLKFCVPPSVQLDASAMATLDLSLNGADVIDTSATARAVVEGALTISLGSASAAAAALETYATSALAPIVTGTARPRAAAKASAAIAASEFEVELTPA